ncbi:RNA polymerase subunit sigma-70 [Saccharobesus litoralis]|uniref:RNA polymerase subunit sigma-70 n=1 Tax=Saccharobesus litoralis TaxID=2172099 RepID=A0A2S0VNQ0_9ALTE|nr:RNA polymerase sigma factor [Saccharobesus litoralis]AWB65845.1 RNA polymerase subunit sigma-70 [Saccharobesus litoralis]
MSQDPKLNSIFLSSRGLISRLLSRIVPPSEIEDIVQETYVRICQIDNKSDIKSPRSFMVKTAKNIAYDYLKSSAVKTAAQNDENEQVEQLLRSQNDDEMYQVTASREEFSDFCESIRQLPLQCRKVFILKKVYGFSQKEIAEKLEISQSTVEKHIAAGMKRCMQFMLEREHLSPATQTKFAANKQGARHE